MLAIKGGKILTISNGVIENGIILIEDGKIKDVGQDIVIPDGVKVIDASGKVVMPGLVEAHCHIGIYEEGVGWAGEDGNEMTTPATPEVRALDGIKANADEKGLEVALKTGITTANIMPGSANVIGGWGVVVKTAPKVVVDDMVLMNPSGMKCAFGENPMRVYGQMLKKYPMTRMGEAAILRKWLQNTKTYMEKKEQFKDEPEKMPDKDLQLESLIPVLERKIPLKVHSHRADDIAIAIRVAEEFNVKVTWEHATEGHRNAEWIAKKGIPAIWGPSLLGRMKWEMRELSFDTPLALYKAGVKFCIQTDALGQVIGFLPICAALAVKHGIPEDVALRAITLTPAEILGVDDRVGSIEKGKDADIRIIDGEPLDIQTKVEIVIIDGKIEYQI